MTRAGTSYDLAIVGAGIAGMMTAVLARRSHPYLRILVVDRSIVGAGATAYSAFLDLPYGVTEAVRALSTRSMQLYRELRAALPALPIRDVSMYGVCREDGLADIMARLTQPGARIVPTAELARTAEGSGPAISGAPHGFAVPHGGVVFDGLVATRCVDASLVDVLVRHFESTPRSRIVEGAEVARLARSGEETRIELSDGRAMTARRVAICMGPWLARGLSELTGVDSAIRVKKVVSMLLALEVPANAPVIYLFDRDAFFLPQPERCRWLFSFRSEEWDCPPEASRLRLNTDDLAEARAALETCMPGVIPDPLGARIFCDGYTADRRPLVASIAGLPGVVAIGGSGGSGVRLAPAMAERGLELLGLPVGSSGGLVHETHG